MVVCFFCNGYDRLQPPVVLVAKLSFGAYTKFCKEVKSQARLGLRSACYLTGPAEPSDTVLAGFHKYLEYELFLVKEQVCKDRVKL